MVVYLDGVMGLNFMVDWLLLLGVNRLAGHPPGAGRAACGAALGGGYAGMCLVPGFQFLASGLWRTVSLGMVTVAAFGMDRSAFRRGVLFVILSMALGGLVVSLDLGRISGILFSAGVLVLLCRMGFRGKIGQILTPVTIVCGEKRMDLLALRDTGNTLRDPLTGAPVLIAGPEAAGRLLGLPKGMLSDPVSLAASVQGIRLIPYRAVGTNSGFLPAVMCECVRIGKREGKGLVAFAPESFPGGEYQALIGG